jgi:hypothetical protein
MATNGRAKESGFSTVNDSATAGQVTSPCAFSIVMFNKGHLLIINDYRFLSARIDSGSIARKASMGLGPAILSMIRGHSTRDGADRICRTFVWICKEQAFWLVSAVELLYTLIERSDPAVSSPR